MTLQQLRTERAQQVADLAAIIDKAEAEARVLTDTELEKFNNRATAIIAIDDQLERGLNMDTAPQGALRPLTATSSKLSDGLPTDIAQQIERSGRVAYEVKSSLRVLARNIIGESLTAPNVGISGPTAWRIMDGGLPYTPSLLELLPVVPVTGSGILQHVLDFTQPDDVGNKAAQVAEAAAKPESSLAVTTTTVTFPTWAHWVVCTRQALSDMPSLRQLVDGILIRGLLRKVDGGIYATLSAAATAFVPTAGASVIDNAVLALAALEAIGATSPTVVLNPGDLAKENIAKAEGSGIYIGWPPRIPGSIVASPAIPAGSLLAFSSEAAYVAEREAVNVIAGVKNDDFIKNLLTLLAEWRGIAVLQQPAYLLVGPTAATGTQTQSAHHAGGSRRA